MIKRWDLYASMAVFLFCFLLISEAPLVADDSVSSLPIYPGETIFFETGFSAFMRPAIGGVGGSGVATSFNVSEIWDHVVLGIGGRYLYLVDDASPGSALHFTGMDIHGGWGFTLFKYLGILPWGGAGLSIPFDSSASLSPILTAGVDLRFHLTGREFLILSASYDYPLAGDSSSGISFGLGLSLSSPFIIPISPSKFSLSLNTDRFSPDDDGDNDILDFNLEISEPKSIKDWNLTIVDGRGRLIQNWSGAGAPPGEFLWDGFSSKGELVSSATEYSITFEITDRLGNFTQLHRDILTDILLENINGVFKIRVPSFIFPPNSADISLLTDEERQGNHTVILKIAELLAKFPDYTIRIEGHGNLEEWQTPEAAAKEQDEVLIPLTEARAGAVKDALVALGLEDERISVIGMGGALPLVAFGDEENRWKNRRVEFILLK